MAVGQKGFPLREKGHRLLFFYGNVDAVGKRPTDARGTELSAREEVAAGPEGPPQKIPFAYAGQREGRLPRTRAAPSTTTEPTFAYGPNAYAATTTPRKKSAMKNRIRLRTAFPPPERSRTKAQPAASSSRAAETLRTEAPRAASSSSRRMYPRSMCISP